MFRKSATIIVWKDVAKLHFISSKHSCVSVVIISQIWSDILLNCPFKNEHARYGHDFNLRAYIIGKYGMNFSCLISQWSQGGGGGWGSGRRENNELWTITTIVNGFLEGGSVCNRIINLPFNFVVKFL